MRTSQLARLLNTHKVTRKVFKGVYPCNRIPRTLPKTTAFIVNTDPDGKPGRHWIAYYCTPSHIYFFDSYGQAPWKKELKKPMTLRKYKKYFGRRVQGHSQVCGHYCLYFILAMAKKWSLKCFGNNLNDNDMLVVRLIRHHFYKKPSTKSLSHGTRTI